MSSATLIETWLARFQLERVEIDDHRSGWFHRSLRAHPRNKTSLQRKVLRMDYSELEAKILKHVRRANYQPVKPKVITKKLDLPASERPNVRKAIKRLARRGELAYGANHLVQPTQSDKTPSAPVQPSDKPLKPSAELVKPSDAAKSSTDIIGTFSRTSGGFGFVRPRGVARAPGEQTDIYIPTNQTGDASNGDLVRVRFSPPKTNGKRTATAW